MARSRSRTNPSRMRAWNTMSSMTISGGPASIRRLIAAIAASGRTSARILIAPLRVAGGDGVAPGASPSRHVRRGGGCERSGRCGDCAEAALLEGAEALGRHLRPVAREETVRDAALPHPGIEGREPLEAPAEKE